MTWELWELGKVDRSDPVFVVRRGGQYRVGRQSFSKSWWVGPWRHHLTPRSHAHRCCYGDNGPGKTIDPAELDSVRSTQWTT